jgi:RimJ/RimL family protein N-acetyltransferase
MREIFKIKLHAIEKSDLKLIQSWRNSDNVMPYCRQYRPLSVQDMENWFNTLKIDNDYNLVNDMFMIYDINEPIGVGGLVRIDWRNRHGELSFYIGNTSYCTKEHITQSLLAIMEYAFQTLNLHKVYWPIYSFNPYLEIYEKVMEREYVGLREYYWQGKYWDRIILSKINQGDKCETMTS